MSHLTKKQQAALDAMEAGGDPSQLLISDNEDMDSEMALDTGESSGKGKLMSDAQIKALSHLELRRLFAEQQRTLKTLGQAYLTSASSAEELKVENQELRKQLKISRKLHTALQTVSDINGNAGNDVGAVTIA
jgi:hypothetical protein